VEFLIFAPFVLMLAAFAFKILKHGGLRGALFGVAVGPAIGDVPLSNSRVPKRQMTVRMLHGDELRVGLELVAKGPLSYSIVPIPLSRTEARRLAELLLIAAGE
jgi:hypothetical protein